MGSIENRSKLGDRLYSYCRYVIHAMLYSPFRFINLFCTGTDDKTMKRIWELEREWYLLDRKKCRKHLLFSQTMETFFPAIYMRWLERTIRELKSQSSKNIT